MERLTEIEARLAAIKGELEAPEADLDALETEIRALKEERTGIQEKVEKRQALLDGIVKGEGVKVVKTFQEERKMIEQDKETILASAEYRTAFLKNLQGKPMSVEERTYLTNATTSTGAAVPTPTAELLFEKMIKVAPMLSEITLLRIAGNVRFSAESTRDVAAKHTENADITPAADAIITVSLTGYEYNKVLRVSKSVETMAIAAFEGWITDMLATDIARIIEDAIINGDGSGDPQGVAYAHATWTTTYEISTTASITYDNVMDLIALLPAGYDGNAKFLCNKKFVYGSLAKIVEATTNAPILVKDMEGGLRFNLMGFPIITSDKVADDTMYFGDYKKIVGNLAQDITVERSTESGFLANAIDYRGGAIFDCKCGNSDAFVRFKKN
jgi:HK97 family phage major capsid protein